MILSTFVFTVVLPLLVGIVMLVAVRFVRGPHVLDRVLALDFMTVVSVGILSAYTIATNQPAYLDVAMVIALLSFLGTVGFAYYVEQRNESAVNKEL